MQTLRASNPIIQIILGLRQVSKNKKFSPGIIFIRTQTYTKIFKSALVYL